MRFLRKLLDAQARHFSDEGKLRKLYPLFEATDTFLYSPGTVTQGPPHVRDAMDLKRYMVTVVVALIPPVLIGLYNIGLQANRALQSLGEAGASGWRGEVLQFLGFGVNPDAMVENIAHGALYFLPAYAITVAAGGFWEAIFGCVRRHSISEGFLVTSLLFPLTLPPDIPWWQVVIGISFGVVVGKEIFGGVGMNILNPALTARTFLYFAYPASITGDAIWVAADGYSRATPLAELADPVLTLSVTLREAFLGLIPGSMGETSALACLIGAFILIVTKVGSWRIMSGVVVGMVAISSLMNSIGSETNPMFSVTPVWHFVLGGFAFGTVYMATDPVSSAHTRQGQYVYGILVGALTVLVRVINPGFPEGIMLAILFCNVFAPAIDKIFISQNVRRRRLRNAR